MRFSGSKKERQLFAGPSSIVSKPGVAPRRRSWPSSPLILTAIYHMLKDGTMYHDLGCDHFKRRSTDQQRKRLVKGLADLGYAVELKPLAA
jgi:hypothetical protein